MISIEALSLNIVCSVLQYLEDRGELQDEVDYVITKVRYKPREEIDHFDMAVNGRVMRFTVQDVGEAEAVDEGDY